MAKAKPATLLGDVLFEVQDGDNTYPVVRVMTRNGPVVLEVPQQYLVYLDDEPKELTWSDLGEYADGPDFDPYYD